MGAYVTATRAPAQVSVLRRAHAHEKNAWNRARSLCSLALLRLWSCQSGYSSGARFVLRDLQINASRAE